MKVFEIRNVMVAFVALVLAGCSSTPKHLDAYALAGAQPEQAYSTDEYIGEAVNYMREPTTVRIEQGYTLPVGAVIVSTKERRLYYVKSNHDAYAFDVAVGKDGFTWSGSAHVGEKKVDPTWTPPSEMIDRKPELARWADGMPGGIPENPLGTRAIYLYDQSGKDTLFRIHGTNDPSSIGKKASSGCIRMHNADVELLYQLVHLDTPVLVLGEDDDRARNVFNDTNPRRQDSYDEQIVEQDVQEDVVEEGGIAAVAQTAVEPDDVSYGEPAIGEEDTQPIDDDEAVVVDYE